MVVAHKDYRNATIVFDGLNLQNVTDYDGWARQNFWNNNLLFVLNWFAGISFAWYLTFQNIEQDQLLKNIKIVQTHQILLDSTNILNIRLFWNWMESLAKVRPVIVQIILKLYILISISGEECIFYLEH